MSKEKSPAFASNQRVPDALPARILYDLTRAYQGALIERGQNTSGSEVIRLQFSADEAYHITITRARR